MTAAGKDVAWSLTSPADVKPEDFSARFRLTSSGVPFMVRAAGLCPQCEHDMQSTEMIMELDMFTSGEFTPEALRDITDEANQLAETGRLVRQQSYRCRMVCNCGKPHMGRPVNAADGCGAQFVLIVPGPRS
jgi:hypothetical protein